MYLNQRAAVIANPAATATSPTAFVTGIVDLITTDRETPGPSPGSG
jgi:hypothetical protein